MTVLSIHTKIKVSILYLLAPVKNCSSKKPLNQTIDYQIYDSYAYPIFTSLKKIYQAKTH
jgi:hypothetical protein